MLPTKGHQPTRPTGRYTATDKTPASIRFRRLIATGTCEFRRQVWVSGLTAFFANGSRRYRASINSHHQGIKSAPADSDET